MSREIQGETESCGWSHHPLDGLCDSDVEESLMGLGLVAVRKEGAQEEQVARVDQQTKNLDPEAGSVVSGGQTQSQIDSLMRDLLNKYNTQEDPGATRPSF